MQGFDYSRCGNPIRNVLQNCIASLDGGKHCLTYASGLAATTAVIQLLKSGDHVLCGDDMYGGTNRYFSKIASKFGVKFTITDMTNDKNIAKLILPETKVSSGLGQVRGITAMYLFNGHQSIYYVEN